jgi:integrase
MAGKFPIPPHLEAPVRQALDKFIPRDKCLVLVGLNTGFRAFELSSITVGQLLEADGRIRSHVTVSRRHTKGGQGENKCAVKSRRVALNAEASQAIRDYLGVRFSTGEIRCDEPLFLSREGRLGLSRWSINRIVKQVLAAAGDDRGWKYGSHTLRKGFCRGIYQATKFDLNLTRVAMGHVSIQTTIAYLPVDEAEIDAAVNALAGTPAAPVKAEAMID